ncbi:MAG: phosphatase PAP2 family protein [Bacteroidetes bacterium]|nr:phosphatase PAP2 family protein [Bacteroidota bacterium]
MIEFLDALDKELFLFLNGFHSPFMDQVMFRLTNQLTWIPFFLFIIYILSKNYKRQTLWILLGVVIAITLSDQLVSGIMKPLFERLRPSHSPDLEVMVHTVNGYKGGLYGFASSHAANSFGLAMFLWRVSRDKIKWIWVMFAWAVLFSYTRIYLGVHYPGDIITGGLLGAGFGYLTALLYAGIPHGRLFKHIRR